MVVQALIISILIFAVLMLFYIATYVPWGLYFTARAAGVEVTPKHLIEMKLRRVNPKAVIEPLIMGVQSRVSEINAENLEAHYLAGGNVARLVRALIEADKARIPLGFDLAAAIDLAGRDVLEAITMVIKPKVIQTPAVSAMAKDGIQVRAVCRVTVKANIERLVGGAGEDTVLARVGEGTVTTIGSSDTYEVVLENPNAISQRILGKGLDSGTAFDILSIDIMDVDVGRNIGAHLQIDRAEADKQIAQAKAEERRAEAAAREEEMRAQVEEMQAKLVEAESRVPLGLATALRSGRLKGLN